MTTSTPQATPAAQALLPTESPARRLSYHIGSAKLAAYMALCQCIHLVTPKRPLPRHMEEAGCAVCGATRPRYLFSRRDRLRYANLSENRFYGVVKCRTCGHVYINPRLRESVLREIYENDLFESYKYDASHVVKVSVLYDAYHDRLQDRLETFERYLNVIQKYAAAGNLLDVGTCFAYFLRSARQRGFLVSGVELSRQCVAFSRETLGIEAMVQGTLLEASLPASSYDAITSWHSIEHLYEPAPTIRTISTLLKSGGYFFLTCPIHTEHYLVRSVQPIEHLHYFRRDTLKRLVLANLDGEFVAEDDLVFIFRKR